MSDRISTERCREARRLVHERLDGEKILPDAAERLERHLAECVACSDAARDLRRIGAALRNLPPATFPPAALARVERATRGRRHPAARRIAWRGLSSAAAALLVAFGALSLREAAPPAGQDAEVIAAAGELRLAFALAAREIDRSERVALDRVVRERFAPALARVPIFKTTAAGREGEEDDE